MARTPLPTAEAVVTDLRERGYAIDRPTGSTTPAAVATGGDPPAARTDAPLAVEPLAEVSPLQLVARLADAARNGHAPLLVVDDRDAERALDVLRDPLLVRDETDGRRTFYTIPDRIHLPDGTLACVRTDGAYTWRETAPGGITAERDDEGDTAPELVLETEGQVVAAFDSVDGLTCPGPDPGAFPYRYARGEDKRIHVFDREREVGRYGGIAAMKANAYQPVPLPLVPEHHVREDPALARRWLVATTDDSGVTYHTA